MYVVDVKTHQTHRVNKYVFNGDEESIWCNTWYGRHIIGQDCKFIQPELICSCGKIKASQVASSCFDCFANEIPKNRPRYQ